MYAGGLSYFSSGFVRDGLRVGSSPAPEAVAIATSEPKQMKKRVLDTIKHPKLKKGDRISEHARGVHQIFSTQTGHANASALAKSVHECQMDTTPLFMFRSQCPIHRKRESRNQSRLQVVIPKSAKWQRFGNQIGPVLVLARSDFVNVLRLIRVQSCSVLSSTPEGDSYSNPVTGCCGPCWLGPRFCPGCRPHRSD
jgi:hypothetical protein